MCRARVSLSNPQIHCTLHTSPHCPAGQKAQKWCLRWTKIIQYPFQLGISFPS